MLSRNQFYRKKSIDTYTFDLEVGHVWSQLLEI